jgi:hypothetical protein
LASALRSALGEYPAAFPAVAKVLCFPERSSLTNLRAWKDNRRFLLGLAILELPLSRSDFSQKRMSRVKIGFEIVQCGEPNNAGKAVFFPLPSRADRSADSVAV